MAFADYGAVVYRNGERRPDRENVTAFDDGHMDGVWRDARIWAHLLRKAGSDQPWEQLFHAVLGDGVFRVCVRKTWPHVFHIKPEGDRDIVEVKLYDHRANPDADVPETDWSPSDYEPLDFTIDGWRVRYSHLDDSKADVSLIEPDGTVWSAHCGYGVE